MAILDRPMFQRPLTKDQLRGYGIPAFANGGVVRMRNGGDPSGLFTPGGLGQKIIEDKKKKPVKKAKVKKDIKKEEPYL